MARPDLKFTIEVDTSKLVKGVTEMGATIERIRIARMKEQASSLRTTADIIDRAAERAIEAYVARHGMTPAEHAYRKMVKRKLDHPRWSPQP